MALAPERSGPAVSLRPTALRLSVVGRLFDSCSNSLQARVDEVSASHEHGWRNLVAPGGGSRKSSGVLVGAEGLRTVRDSGQRQRDPQAGREGTTQPEVD